MPLMAWAVSRVFWWVKTSKRQLILMEREQSQNLLRLILNEWY